MIITRKAIPRRTVLRGLGTTLALPLLNGMVPALAPLRNTAARPLRRLGVVYVPNGIVMGKWSPAEEASGLELSPILQPLTPFRDRLLVLSGLNGAPNVGGGHAGASTRFLTGVGLQEAAEGSELRAGFSMDQLVARELGRDTQLASLELALDGRDFSGSCDSGYSCAFTNTICWRDATTPLPMENNPRKVFERLFGEGGTTDPTARLARIQKDRSILDSVTEKAADLQRGLGPRDRVKLRQYLEAVRDVERRIQKAEEQSAEELPVVDQPPGIPDTFGEHARLMFDLQALAYRTDLTRVTTCMMGREITGRTYAEIGIPDAHHPISHHKEDPEKIEKLVKINTYHVTLFSEFLEKLRTTPDGDGSLLDHVMILYGAGMADGDTHDPENLPILLAGGGSGQLRPGRHLRYEGEPLANLHLTLMEQMGVRMERLGHSTGKLDLLSVA